MNSKDLADRFHGHLDTCKQCRDNPFGLCKTGELLLFSAAAALPFPAPVSPETSETADATQHDTAQHSRGGGRNGHRKDCDCYYCEH